MNTQYLRGARVQLSPFKKKHFTRIYISWLNDQKVVKFSEQRHQRHTKKSCITYIKRKNSKLFAIELHNSLHIGNISVHKNTANKTADIGILIGEKKEWGKGYGTEALGLVLKMLLQDRAIRKITAGSMAENKSMIKIAHACGMHVEAIVPKFFLWKKKEIDLVLMAKYNARFKK